MFKDNAATALKAVKDVYDQHIVISTEFRNLKDLTSEALAEYKRLNERLFDRIDALERERFKSESEMLKRISTLEARLAAMTEQAMISAVREETRDFVREASERPVQNPDPKLLPYTPDDRER